VDDGGNKDLSDIDSTMIFGDDFRNGVLGSQWNSTFYNYCEEKDGSFSPTGDIDIKENIGNLEIYGTGTINTTTVDGTTVGWLGKSVRGKNIITDNIVFETEVNYVSGYIANDSGSSNGYGFGLSIEYDSNNIIRGELKNVSGTIYDGAFLSGATGNIFTPQLGIYRLKLQHVNSNYTFYYNESFLTATNTTVTSGYPVLFATVRNVGDKIDVKFNFVFVRQYLSVNPQIEYIRPKSKLFYIKNTIFTQSSNPISYNTNSYIETPVIELTSI